VLNVTPSDLKNCPVDMLSAHPLLREKTDFVRPINVICPVQICLKEYSASRSAQITGVSIASRPTGAFRDRHERWAGDAVDAAALARHVMQGAVKPVSGQRRADGRCCCARPSRVVPTPRRWRQLRGGEVGPTGSISHRSRGDHSGVSARRGGMSRVHVESRTPASEARGTTTRSRSFAVANR
jgi:hypothetical protein